MALFVWQGETQGTIDIANRTFKRRLGARQTQLGTREWVALIADLIMMINITPSEASSDGFIPYEVFFGRKPPHVET